MGSKSRGRNRRVYIGYTNHLGKRLAQHLGITSGRGARGTREQELELAYLETFTTRKKARVREIEFKKSPMYKKKETRLAMIAEFQKNNEDMLKEVNRQLEVFFQEVKKLRKSIEIFTNEMISLSKKP